MTKDNLEIVSESQDLLKEARKFYRTLFTVQPCDAHARNEFLNCSLSKLPDDERMPCKGIITEHELKRSSEGYGMQQIILLRWPDVELL